MPDDPPSAVESPPAPGRKRRILRRALKYTAATCTILAIAYAALCIWYYRQTPKLTRNYAAELNAATLKVPPEKRAWTHYRRALEVLEPRQENEFAEKPGDKDWHTTAAYLKRNAAAIQMLRDAARMRPMGIVLQDGLDPADIAWQLRHHRISEDEANHPRQSSENPLVIGLTFEHTSAGLDISRVLNDDFKLAVAEKDSTRALANLLAMLDLAEQVVEFPTIVAHLIATTIAEMAIDKTVHALHSSDFTFPDEDLSALAIRLREAYQSDVFMPSMTGEHVVDVDFLQRYYTDDGNGDGVFTLDGDFDTKEPADDEEQNFKEAFKEHAKQAWDRFRAPIWAAFILPRRRELESASEKYLHDAQREAHTPLWRDVEQANDFVDEIPVTKALHTWDSSVFEPSGYVWTMRKTYAEYKQHVGAARIAVALARDFRTRRQYPASLNDISRDLLREIPPDQFTGKPLRYKLIDNQPTIYSVGADLDDDGGRTPENEPNPYESGVRNFGGENPPDGDWILFPPYKEPPIADEANDEADNQARDNANGDMEDATTEEPTTEDDANEDNTDTPETNPSEKK